MLLKDFKAFHGEHCETTATGSLLSSQGVELSEPLLFGLGEGFSYIIQEPIIHDFPFIGGRISTELLTKNICANLAMDLSVHETSSPKTAWQTVKESLDNGVPVGLKLDCYHLEYFQHKYHFAGHYVAIYGYDETYAYLVDTAQQGRYVKSSLESIARARAERGPMSSRNLSYTIRKGSEAIDLNDAVRVSLRNNALEYLNPHTDNVGYNGIHKTADEMEKWFARSTNIRQDFKTSAVMMERAGTGGALFRNIYRDFLGQAYEMLGDERIKQGYQHFVDIAKSWTSISDLFDRIGERKDASLLGPLAEALHETAEMEAEAMELLSSI